MAEIKSNKDTQLAEAAFADFEFDYGDVPGKEYIESLDIVTTFYDYTYTYAQKNGFDGEKSDADMLAKFIMKLGEKRNAPLSSLNTLKNWLKKAPPSANQAGRENVYTLCFALGLNVKETKEFFLKAYLERPFNYKNIHEAVYFFCFNNGLTYLKAQEIIEKIEAMPKVENPDAEQVTEQIGFAISLITTEDDLIKYLVNNRSGFAVQSQTATNKIKELIEECKALAKKEYKLLHNGDISVENIDELLAVITGYYARETVNGEKLYKQSISKSKLPEIIRKNFPQREQFKQIEEGKASFDTIRKALIMLKFYNFFADALIHNAEELANGLFYEFVDETNELLAECGYVQLYWRNPYDWLFGYCAYGAANPLDEFKNVIDVFYLDDPDTYKETKK